MITIEPTNEDQTRKLVSNAHKALIRGIAGDWRAIEEASTGLGKLTVIAVNRMRACGEKLKQLSGHEQISMGFYLSIQSQLPKTMSWGKAKQVVCIANILSKDVTTPQEAFEASRKTFQILLDFKEPHRLEAQYSHGSNPWDEFVSKGISFFNFFSVLEKEGPMADWPKPKLETFISTTEPIVQKHEEAKALLS